MAAETTRRARTDAASKLLFTGAVVADLLRIRLPALAAALDLDAIEPAPAEFVALDRSKRIGDAAFRVPLRERDRFAVAQDSAMRNPRPSGGAAAFVSVEFQSGDDPGMLGRNRTYTVMLQGDFRQRGIIGPDEHPLTVSVVIHTGRKGWTAADGTELFAALPPAAALEAAPYVAWAYILEDIGAGGPLPAGAEDNRYLAAARLVRCAEVEDLPALLGREWRRFAGEKHEAFRRGMLAWVEEEVLSSRESGLRAPTYEELEGLEDKQMGYLLKEQVESFRAEAEAKGKTAGRMLLLRDLAAHKFGPDVAGRFAELLGSADDATRRAAGAWIIDCAAGDDLLRRLSGAASTG